MNLTKPNPLALIAVLLLTSALARAQGIDFPKTELLTQQLAPDFYTLTGPGMPPGIARRSTPALGSNRTAIVCQRSNLQPVGQEIGIQPNLE